jgi:deoxyadenosine/deoxycytidine kinase
MLICFMGMPSCGKSSTARSLAQLMGAQVFLEPEEKDWPAWIHQRKDVGLFTALTWFRSVRVPQLFEAQRASDDGKIAVVDCYFDKLLHRYMHAEPFNWLLPPSDPYFPVAAQMAKADFRHLPNADCIVFIRCDRKTWNTLLTKRGRQFDASAGLSTKFAMQHYMELACQSAVEEMGGKLLFVDQIYSDANQTADRVHKLLLGLVP